MFQPISNNIFRGNKLRTFIFLTILVVTNISLEYKINPNLEGMVKSEVVERVSKFCAGLNENITYVYVSSILKEFHTAQDNTKIVLSNSKNDLDRLKGIVPEKLLTDIKFPERIFVELKPENSYSTTDFYQVSMEIIEKIKKDIENSTNIGGEKYILLKDNRESVGNEMEFFISQISSMNILQDQDGNTIYALGINKLDDIVNSYNVEAESRKNTILTELNDKTSTNQETIDSNLDTIYSFMEQKIEVEMERAKIQAQDYINIALTEIQIQNIKTVKDKFEEIQRDLKGVLATPSNATPSNATPSNATPSNATPSNATPSDAMRDGIEKVVDHIGKLVEHGILKQAVTSDNINKNEVTDIWIALPEEIYITEHEPRSKIILQEVDYNKQMVKRIEEIFKIPIEDIKTVLKEDIIKTVEAQWRKESRSLLTDAKKVSFTIEEYLKSFDKFNSSTITDDSKVNSNFNDIRSEARNMQNTMNNKTREQEKQVREIERVSEENTDKLENAIRDSRENTYKTLHNTFEELTTKTENNNKENTQLLTNFAKQLSYTRNGSLPNKASYEQISSPVSIKKVENDKAITKEVFIHSNVTEKLLFVIIVGSIILFLLLIMIEKIKYIKLSNMKHRREL